MKIIQIVSDNKALTDELGKIVEKLGYRPRVGSEPPAAEEVAAVVFDAKIGSPASLGFPKDRQSAKYPLVAVTPGFTSLPVGLFDEVVSTPVNEAEFKYRLESALAAKSAGEVAVIRFGDLVINPESYEVSVSGRPVELTYKEYELLRYLAARSGRVCSRRSLLSQIWEYDYFGGTRTVDVHIRRLRSKLGTRYGACIQTVRQVGYRFTWEEPV